MMHSEGEASAVPHRRQGNPRRWRPLRRSVQAAALLLFLVFFLALKDNILPAEMASLAMRVDPLAMLAAMLAARALIAGAAVALLAFFLALVFGRAWCGWLCPLGTLLDWLPLRARRAVPPAVPENVRAVKYWLLIVLLISAILGSLWLLFLDPIALLTRALAEGVWPALDRAVSGVEWAAYGATALQPAVDAVDGLLRPSVLPDVPIYSSAGLLAALPLIVVILLNRIAPLFWCRYLCPLGAFYGLLSKIALVRREVESSACSDCSACARVCPTGTIRPEKNNASDPSECTLCMECIAACPREGQRFTSHLSAAPWNSYDPGRRAFLTGAGLAVAGVALLRADSSAWRDLPFVIQPPGGRENDLLGKCIRCGDCVRACPTGAIHPAALEAGPEALGTPVLIPRLGFCRYDCNACGQICPTGAIPPLPIEEKQTTVIGRAFVEKDRCLAWGDHVTCAVCQEMCPIPEKAIRLESVSFLGADGAPGAVLCPVVEPERCIGCGTCEYKCPVNGTSAIRVYVPGRSEA
jgi:MauM/NapG family ferredoxin protein